MGSNPPRNADELTQRQLHERLAKLEAAFDADALGFMGPLYAGVDDMVRAVVEPLARRAAHPGRLLIILTSSGGYIEVVHRIVDTIRHHYDHVAFVIPNYAYSAGTIFALSGNEIHMDYYSRLGPIDPQVEAPDQGLVPALGYLVQWERLIEKARQGKLTVPEAELMIDGFDQAALYKYEQERELSVALLKDWLVRYKFRDWRQTEARGLNVTKTMRTQRAQQIARILNDTERWHTHGHGISMEVCRRVLKLRIDDLDANPERASSVKEYYNLLDDYMRKLNPIGVLHTDGLFRPYYIGASNA